MEVVEPLNFELSKSSEDLTPSEDIKQFAERAKLKAQSARNIAEVAQAELNSKLDITHTSNDIATLHLHEAHLLRIQTEAALTESEAALELSNLALAQSEKSQKKAEAAEQRYRMILEGSNAGVWDWEVQSNLVYWNGRFFRMLGLIPGQVEPTNSELLALVHPDDQGGLTQAVQVALKHQKHFEKDFRIQLLDKSGYLHCHAKGKASFNDKGETIRFSGTLTDITEQKRLEHELQNSLGREHRIAEREKVIRRIIQTLHSSLDLETTFQELANDLGIYLDADRCFISRYDAVTQVLSAPTREYKSHEEIESISNARKELWPKLCSFATTLCQQAQPIDFSSPAQGISSEVQAHLGEINIKSGIGCSVSYKGECLAVIFIHQVDSIRNWTQDELDVMKAVASQTAVAIHQSQIYQLEQEATKMANKAQAIAENANHKKKPIFS